MKNVSGTHLGERKETLGDGDDILHLLNRLDAVLDDLGVLRAGGVEDVEHAVDVALRPVPVRLLRGLEMEKQSARSDEAPTRSSLPQCSAKVRIAIQPHGRVDPPETVLEMRPGRPGEMVRAAESQGREKSGHDAHLVDEGDEDEEAGGDDGLLVDHVELLGDGGREEAGAEDGGAGFGDEVRGGGERVDDLRRALLRRGLRRARHAPTASVWPRETYMRGERAAVRRQNGTTGTHAARTRGTADTAWGRTREAGGHSG